ncbi:MAG: hypothetical protein AAF745_11650 [Planctomycetota bacterium]
MTNTPATRRRRLWLYSSLSIFAVVLICVGMRWAGEQVTDQASMRFTVTPVSQSMQAVTESKQTRAARIRAEAIATEKRFMAERRSRLAYEASKRRSDRHDAQRHYELRVDTLKQQFKEASQSWPSESAIDPFAEIRKESLEQLAVDAPQG